MLPVTPAPIPCKSGGFEPYCCENNADNKDCCLNGGYGPHCCHNGADNKDCCLNGGKGRYCCPNGEEDPYCCGDRGSGPYCCDNGSFWHDCRRETTTPVRPAYKYTTPLIPFYYWYWLSRVKSNKTSNM